MAQFGYADKYSSVGWKATIPGIESPVDVVGFIGDMVIPFRYDEDSHAFVTSESRKVSGIWPAMPDGGTFNYSQFYPLINVTVLGYYVNSTQYYLALYPENKYSTKYAAKSLPSDMGSYTAGPWYWRPRMIESATALGEQLTVATYTFDFQYTGTLPKYFATAKERATFPSTVVEKTTVNTWEHIPQPIKSLTLADLELANTVSTTNITVYANNTTGKYVSFAECPTLYMYAYGYRLLQLDMGLTKVAELVYPANPASETTPSFTVRYELYTYDIDSLTVGVQVGYDWYQIADLTSSIITSTTGIYDLTYNNLTGVWEGRATLVPQSAENSYTYGAGRYLNFKCLVGSFRTYCNNISSYNTLENWYWGGVGTGWLSNTAARPVSRSRWIANYAAGIRMDLFTQEVANVQCELATQFDESPYNKLGTLAAYLPYFGVATFVSAASRMDLYTRDDILSVASIIGPAGAQLNYGSNYMVIRAPSTVGQITEPPTLVEYSLVSRNGIVNIIVDPPTQTPTLRFTPFKVKYSDGSLGDLERAWTCVSDLSSAGLFDPAMIKAGYRLDRMF